MNPRFLPIGTIAVASLSLVGCIPGLVYTLDPAPVRLEFSPQQAQVAELGLSATASYLGPGERIPTARTVLGNILRVVDPYGEDQISFDVTVRNASDRLATLRPQFARLVVPDETVTAQTLQDYKRAWPTYPIADDDMALDQAAAFSFVVRTLLLEQQLMPGDSAEGRIAFKAPAGAKGPAVLELPAAVGETPATLSFEYRLAIPVSTASAP